ncbi:ABC transporter ATP-binding protein [Oceanobacillus zhaokaii]|uniref:ABC transporter ATP-binding protein n=1 Tax=Oceanobacillus zhaokaii TaxID=2052660 RepID=A0A345PIV0_9BACI|nr:ABC transporter ATP-binding protein [Oceanobacillus zhaokaii]AXI09930.1 ABC transporter ATP-binding protein [Oceanobacillus zhaokaii]
MVLEVKGVTKVFKRPGKAGFIANDNLTFQIKEGEIFGLLGQNGAGKTTLVNQILGLYTPDEGDIHLLGESVLKSPTRSRSICSMQPQSQISLGSLTPMDAVTLMGKMRAGKKYDPKRAEKLFESLNMGEWLKKEGQSLSGGARRLTAFCMAVIVPGKLVILDEPTNDVDPVRRRYLWQVIRELTDDGTSVILVTHNVLEAEKVVDRVAIMHKGRILTQGTPGDVKQPISHQIRMEISLTGEKYKMVAPKWVISSFEKGTRLIYTIDSDEVSTAIDWAKSQVDSGFLIDYNLSPATIEDIYIKLTSGEEMQA